MIETATASATALWLDTHLAGFDHLFLMIQHFFAEYLGFILTPLMRIVTFLGEKGWIFFLLALLFMLTSDRRDLGVCIFGAVCCGALITNIILKDNVCRLRPFESGNVDYQLWWEAVGKPAEEGFSFPSGHVTACAAGMTAITMMRGKKWIIPSVILVVLMAVSRNYLMAHYPSDVVAAALIGVFSGIVAWFITQLIFRFLNRYRSRIPLCGFLLDFDIRDVLPFQLPALPFLGGRERKAAAPSRGSRGRPAEDEDVKPYPARGGRAGAERSAARTEAPSRAARRAEAAPAARSGGRHSLPETSDGAGAKSARRRAPGGYQGKH